MSSKNISLEKTSMKSSRVMQTETTDTLRQSARTVIANLRELAALTSTPAGAQRVAWGPVWRQAREWLAGKVAPLGLAPVADSAGNNWITLPGSSERTVIIGGHLDSVPNGGWLDGCLGVTAALEALRQYAGSTKPPVTLALVDWARSEEHTSELQSQFHLVCRLLLEKKKKRQ